MYVGKDKDMCMNMYVSCWYRIVTFRTSPSEELQIGIPPNFRRAPSQVFPEAHRVDAVAADILECRVLGRVRVPFELGVAGFEVRRGGPREVGGEVFGVWLGFALLLCGGGGGGWAVVDADETSLRVEVC